MGLVTNICGKRETWMPSSLFGMAVVSISRIALLQQISLEINRDFQMHHLSTFLSATKITKLLVLGT